MLILIFRLFKLTALKIIILFSITAHAFESGVEFFPNLNPADLSEIVSAPENSTVGGYPIYLGGLNWKTLQHKVSKNNLKLPIGQIQLISPRDGKFHAEINLMVNLGTAQPSEYFLLDNCAAGIFHLKKRNKGGGQMNDDCLTLDVMDAIVGKEKISFFKINIYNTKSAGRFYNFNLLLNISSLGYPSAGKEHWDALSLEKSPDKQKIIDSLFQWAIQIQDAVGNAMAFSKPKNVFRGVKSIDVAIQEAIKAASVIIPSINNTSNAISKLDSKIEEIPAHEYFIQGKSAYDRRDFKLAVQLFEMASGLGNAEALVQLGSMHQYGRGGLVKDEVKSVKLFELAATQGHPQAQVNLGYMYRYGRGGLPQDDSEAVKWYRLSANQGNAHGQNNFGAMYANGLGGLPKDDFEAVKWYRLSAEKGFSYGQNNLGFMFREGRGGLIKDEAESVKWFKLAAAQGNVNGQYNLGFMYEFGRGGLAKDSAEAARLYRLAADKGNSAAKSSLERFNNQ